MKAYQCLGLFLTLSLWSCSSSLSGTGTAQAEDWREDYAAYVQEVMEDEEIPGLALGIVEGQEIVWAEGYGLRDLDNRLPVTPETLFNIASTHKSMTAMLVGTVVDEGLLDWDQPLVSVVPSFYLFEPLATETVTIRHLLSMTGGIPEEAEEELFEGATAADIFEIIGETPLLGEPGEVFNYSNLSSAASGYMAALVSGSSLETLYEDYGQLLRERILDPIGMDTATLSSNEVRQRPDYALSYVLSDGEAVLSESYDVEGDPLAPSGALKANVVEMAQYVATQLNGGVAPNGNRVISTETLQQTWEPMLENYGMGWEIRDYGGMEIISHTGSYDDFGSVIGFVPELGVGFVILLNCEEAGAELVEDAPYVLVDLLIE